MDPKPEKTDETPALDAAEVRSQLQLPPEATDEEVISKLIMLIAALQNKLEEGAKTAETEMANRIIESYGDKIPTALHDTLREQFLTNRETAMLLMEAIAGKPETPTAPVAPAATPLKNRIGGYLAKTVATVAETPAAPADEDRRRAGAIRNRASEIQKSTGCSFLAAFSRAEVELS